MLELGAQDQVVDKQILCPTERMPSSVDLKSVCALLQLTCHPCATCAMSWHIKKRGLLEESYDVELLRTSAREHCTHQAKDVVPFTARVKAEILAVIDCNVEVRTLPQAAKKGHPCTQLRESVIH